MNMICKAVSLNQRVLRPLGDNVLCPKAENKIRPAAVESGGISSIIAEILATTVKVPPNQEPASIAGAQ